MKNDQKPKYYYIIIFAGSVLMMGIYMLMNYLEGTLQMNQVWIYAIVPFLFTGVYWGGDSLIRKIRKRKTKVDYEQLFLDAIGQRMRNSNAFIVEDYRRLQESQRFQEALKSAYFVYQSGEETRITLDHLEKKFEKRTVEFRAMQFVTAFVREKLAEKSK